ncbi:MAG: hypothetical protein LUD69_04190, partial [Oscillospiraceae bacterium]|nr:hypothetical protein [Oscillospiraceae bacterium]
MPGGMGGLGGMLGGLLGGGGGPGGGMGGMGGMMGGMNRNSQTQQTTQQTSTETSDVYDVDRWKRADGMDEVENKTNVQQVRDAWDKQAEEKKKNSLLSRIKARFSKKKKEEEPPRRNGTITMPEAKKAQKRINNGKDDLPGEAPDYVPVPAPVLPPETAAMVAAQTAQKPVNYLGLTCYSDLDGFFTANPVNSAILAVDSLGLSSLTLNQVFTPVDAGAVPGPAAAAAPPGTA